MLLCGHRAYDWNIIAAPRDCGGRRPMSRLSMRMIPASGVTNPAIARGREVLPQPLLPSNPTIWPRSTSSPIQSSTGVSPYDTVRARSRETPACEESVGSQPMLRFKYDADVPPLPRPKDPTRSVVGAFLP
jgi:hypothetical protein